MRDITYRTLPEPDPAEADVKIPPTREGLLNFVIEIFLDNLFNLPLDETSSNL